MIFKVTHLMELFGFKLRNSSILLANRSMESFISNY